MTVEYSRHIVRVADQADVSRVLRDIGGLGGRRLLIAVNLSSTADSAPVFFSDESLRALLAGGADQLVVEALPLAVYVGVVGQQIDHVIGEGEKLRSELCGRDVAELAAQVGAFLALVDRLLLLVGGFALQRRQYGAVPEAGPLESLRRQLATSSLELCDNSRTMDDIHYELVPMLVTIKQALEACSSRSHEDARST